ncbi:MAG: Cro/Cl family transcriptional regulator, partial [Ponticaulis sp.]|nr:Cro/Cl family transcriptional regulator [Ponticaulis sp.]
MQRQLAETPDGKKYLCLAVAVTKRSGGFKDPVRRYALALGCEIRHAGSIVYADDLPIE